VRIGAIGEHMQSHPSAASGPTALANMMKNWLPLVPFPLLAMLSRPRCVCR